MVLLQQYIQVIQYLLSQNEWTTSATLSLSLHRSVRSVKNYVTAINNIEDGLISSSKKGYLINKDAASGLLAQYEVDQPQTSKERVQYLLRVFLTTDIRESRNISLYDLMDELYIGSTTLRSDLNKVREQLERYDLNLSADGDFVLLEGSEKNRRRMIGDVLLGETNQRFLELADIQGLFPESDVSYIKDTIEQVCQRYCYFINDYSMNSLVLHISIAVDRIRSHYSDSLTQTKKILGDSQEYLMTGEMADLFSEKFGITLNQNERHELYLLLISRTTRADGSLNDSSLEELIGVDYLNIVKMILKEMDDFFYVTLDDPDFIARLSIHVKNLVIRGKTYYYVKNPLTATIKNRCPAIYEIAVFITGRINELFQIHATDDEITYIAFHIGGALEEQRNLDNKVSCILVCPRYYDMNLKLVDSLKRRFCEDLLITSIAQDAKGLPRDKKADFILTTMDAPIISATPICKISPFLTTADLQAIQQQINRQKDEKKNRILKQNLYSIFSPEIFTVGSCYKTRDEAIQAIVAVMEDKGYVRTGYLNEIMDREQMSSTAFGNIAIPHSMRMDSLQTAIYVLIQEKAIHWGQATVNVVLLFSINKNERSVFCRLFESITDILSESRNVQKIIGCKNCEEFIDILASQFNKI